MRSVYTYKRPRLDGLGPAKIRKELTPPMASPHKIAEIEREVRARALKHISRGDSVRLIENPAGRWHTLWVGEKGPAKSVAILASGKVRSIAPNLGQITVAWDK